MKVVPCADWTSAYICEEQNLSKILNCPAVIVLGIMNLFQHLDSSTEQVRTGIVHGTGNMQSVPGCLYNMHAVDRGPYVANNWNVLLVRSICSW